MGPIGVQELVVIFLVALVLFGPKKLPELGRTIAKAVTEFRRAQSDLKATFEREMQSLERENQDLKEVTRQAAVDISGFSDELSLSANYGSESQDSAAVHSTVSASEVSGAESHAEPQLGLFGDTQEPAADHAASNGVPPSQPAPMVVPAEGAIPRTEAAANAQTHPVENAHPDPEKSETVQHS